MSPYNALRADVAQLVEHFTRNEGVRGSSPRVGFHYLMRFPTLELGERVPERVVFAATIVRAR